MLLVEDLVYICIIVKNIINKIQDKLIINDIKYFFSLFINFITLKMQLKITYKIIGIVIKFNIKSKILKLK